jgi:hypothetical protein
MHIATYLFKNAIGYKRCLRRCEQNLGHALMCGRKETIDAFERKAQLAVKVLETVLAELEQCGQDSNFQKETLEHARRSLRSLNILVSCLVISQANRLHLDA